MHALGAGLAEDPDIRPNRTRSATRPPAAQMRPGPRPSGMAGGSGSKRPMPCRLAGSWRRSKGGFVEPGSRTVRIRSYSGQADGQYLGQVQGPAWVMPVAAPVAVMRGRPKADRPSGRGSKWDQGPWCGGVGPDRSSPSGVFSASGARRRRRTRRRSPASNGWAWRRLARRRAQSPPKKAHRAGNLTIIAGGHEVQFERQGRRQWAVPAWPPAGARGPASQERISGAHRLGAGHEPMCSAPRSGC